MAGAFEQLDTVPGFTIPVHRALTEHILLGGAPRSIAIMNGTLAGAVASACAAACRLAIWAIGHFAAVWAAKRDPQFVEVGRRQLRIPRTSQREGAAMMNLRLVAPPAGLPTSYPGRARRPRHRLEQGRLIPGTAKFRVPTWIRRRAELVAGAGRINNAVAVADRAVRVSWRRSSEAATYPTARFRSASGLLDAERKAAFEEAGAHFVSGYFLTFLYLPPAEEAARAETWLYEGREQSGVDPHEVMRGFVDRTDRVLALLDGFMPECAWLDDSETLTYLHSTVSTKRHRVRVPKRRSISTRCYRSAVDRRAGARLDDQISAS